MTYRKTPEFKRRLSALRNAASVQCRDGNWNYDPYMFGMANGIILAVHIMEGQVGEPFFFLRPKRWLKNLKRKV